MESFNIIGSCISRDIFNYDSMKKYRVMRFMQCSMPINWFSPSYTDRLVEEDIELSELVTPWIRRSIVCDYNHTFLDVYNEKSDYIIIDCSEFARYQLAIKSDDSEHMHTFTYSDWLLRAINDNVLPAWIMENVSFVSNEELWTDKKIEEVAHSLCLWLREQGYNEKSIVLIENKFASDFLNFENEFELFNNPLLDANKKNKTISLFNTYIKKEFEKKESYTIKRKKYEYYSYWRSGLHWELHSVCVKRKGNQGYCYCR